LQKQARNLFGNFSFPNFPQPFTAPQDENAPSGSTSGTEHKP